MINHYDQFIQILRKCLEDEVSNVLPRSLHKTIQIQSIARSVKSLEEILEKTSNNQTICTQKIEIEVRDQYPSNLGRFVVCSQFQANGSTYVVSERGEVLCLEASLRLYKENGAVLAKILKEPMFERTLVEIKFLNAIRAEYSSHGG